MPWDFWLIFLFLAVILPWRGLVRLRKLLSAPAFTTADRLSLYASTIAFQWLLTAIAGWRAWARGYSATELGLSLNWSTGFVVVAALGAIFLPLGQWLNLRRTRKLPPERRRFFELLANRIFPQSSMELLPYLALAATAGICEEFLYRGFTMAVLLRHLPSWGAVLISSFLFGLAHTYQGIGGVMSTLLIGTVFGAARIAYDSLAPVAVWHFAIDAIAGIVGPRYLSPTSESALDLQNSQRGN